MVFLFVCVLYQVKIFYLTCIFHDIYFIVNYVDIEISSVSQMHHWSSDFTRNNSREPKYATFGQCQYNTHANCVCIHSALKC